MARLERTRRHTKRVFIGIIGGLVVVIGLILVPYPGPGWLVVFAGLAILATEFERAEKILIFGRARYDKAVVWFQGQHIIVKLASLAVTGLIVMVTVWLINGFGIANSILGLGWDWTVSPLFR